jgi:hypothetical protein
MTALDEFEPKRRPASSPQTELPADERAARRAKAGLCADCIHTRCVKSDRSVEFYLCALHAVDPSFPKYPRLPVMRCGGYEANDAAS